ncbi:MAG: hypothetical protein Q4B67_00100 [Eubacteriales bacterium]|nr:hypothetical protein [Eubacteriales bacterium]
MKNDFRKLKTKALFAAVWMVILAVVISASTYAWFTSNTNVNTTHANVHVAVKELQLELGESEADLRPMTEAEGLDIPQVNQANLEKLMPVSTSDLEGFVYSTGSVTSEGGDVYASSFSLDEEEKYYFHGEFYMRALAERQSENAKMALYFSTPIGGDETQGDAFNSARVGFKFDDGLTRIFRVSEGESGVRTNNTYVEGALADENSVLNWNGGGVSVVEDPSLEMARYIVGSEYTDGTLPEEPICYLELNRVYKVDVYYYMEGCDPDCSESAELTDMNLNLSFYGILTEAADE